MSANGSDGRISLTVEYCADCGYWPRTAWMLSEILTDVQHLVSEVRVIPAPRGVFAWRVDGDLIYSKAALGRFPDLDELRELVYARLD